ncbi:hypothetical protein Hanom_Chr08g00708491 [Helianthus anomalus]
MFNLNNTEKTHEKLMMIWRKDELKDTCPLAKPTERSAMKLSSVSQLRWLTITPHPAPFESRTTWIDSVTIPIWLT